MLQTYDFLYKEAKIYTGVKSAPSINSAGQTARLKEERNSMYIYHPAQNSASNV